GARGACRRPAPAARRRGLRRRGRRHRPGRGGLSRPDGRGRGGGAGVAGFLRAPPPPRPRGGGPRRLPRGGGRRRAGGGARRGWRDGDGMRIVLCYGAFGFGYIIPATFVPSMARGLVADPLVFGWSWPAFGIAAAGSTLAGAGGVRLLGHRRLWAVSSAVMAV